MTRPVDLSKFRKSVTKSITGISSGFNDPKTWISTGNYCLNYLISGNFEQGIPLSKVTVLAGESGSGKSLVASGNLVKNAQDQGIFVVLLDSENALDEDWLKSLEVDTDPSKLLRLGVSMIDDVAQIINEFMKGYKDDHLGAPEEERPKVLFVIDSLGMLLTPTDVTQFEKGDMKGDFGRKPKALTALVRNVVNLIAEHEIGIVATNHTYASQDMFDPDDKISGGSGFIYASSIVVAMKKKKLKEDADGNKITEQRGIKSSCKVVKSRFSKPFETVDINVPYDTGMDPYSGLFDMFLKTGIFVKQGNRYKYISKETGEEILLFKKHWTGEHLDKVMAEFEAEDFVVASEDDDLEHAIEEE